MSSHRILHLFKSRQTLMALLGAMGYVVDGYDKFSITEVDTMNANAQMDMLVSHATDGSKIYVRYHVTDKATGAKLQKLEDMVHDIFEKHELQKETDTLMVVVDDEPNDSSRLKQQKWYEQEGLFVVVHALARLQFNLLDHVLVPAAVRLSPEDTAAFRLAYHVQDNSQLPEIKRFDPLALAICLRPGQVCRLTRKSPTAMVTHYYRLCVA